MPQKGGLRDLMSHFADERETAAVLTAIRRAFAWQEPSMAISLRDWLLQYIQNEKILAIFRGLVNYQCVNFRDMPAGEFIRQLKFGTGATAGAHPQGFLALMQELVGDIEAGGGRVWTSARARSIVVRGGAARGIVVERNGSSWRSPPGQPLLAAGRLPIDVVAEALT